ncbi:MAG: thiamine pyrophosphate protein domain protein TPP-binding protein [Enterovirga sp.]|nr:thiamine pyrophosphate protein domain protein TPP-binding protein [Enterovirga sp.]
MQDEASATVSTGAEALVRALVDEGVTVFFANPGTSELHAVSAIDREAGARGVLCLFEGVATGAADGYGRIARSPAATLLHLGPGLANGMANLHNARQAGSPMVVVVGEHSGDHLAFDSPLKSDLERLPPYYSKGVRTLRPGDDMAAAAAEAVHASMSRPAGISTLVAPADAMWAPPSRPSRVEARPRSPETFDTAVADRISAALRGGSAALILGGEALLEDGLTLAGRIAAATGATLLSETFNARHSRGGGLPHAQRIPYFPELAAPLLAKFGLLVLLGSKRPTSFFGSPNQPSDLVASDTVVIGIGPGDDPVAVLRHLAESMAAGTAEPIAPARQTLPLPTGPLTAGAIWAAMNHLMPDGSIVCEEAGVSSRGADEAMSVAARHEWLNLTGGSIGDAVSLAVGAAVAAPGAKVFAVQGDGGALYTIQALWTHAREKLNVLTVIMNNGRYAILDYEAKRHGISLGARGASLFDLASPSIEWVQVARGLGVEAATATTAEEFSDRLREAIAADGPRLIDARLSRPPRK